MLRDQMPSASITQSLPSDEIRLYINNSKEKGQLTYPETFETSTGQVITLDEFIIHCTSIAGLLMDIETCTTYITKLEKILADKIACTPDVKPQVKVLRNTLECELSALGFYPKFAKSFTNFPAHSFFAAMRTGLMIKDAYEGYNDHGEFTHIIQWLIIAWHQAKTNFLNMPAIEIFKMIGKDKSGQYLNVWDILFEVRGEQNFSSPETLNRFICGKEPHLSITTFPELKALLTNRQEKRATQRRKNLYGLQEKEPSASYEYRFGTGFLTPREL